MKPLSFDMWFFYVWPDESELPKCSVIWFWRWEAFPSLTGCLCFVLSHEAWIWIFAIHFHAQPWNQFHTFDLCFLILPEAEGKWVIEARVFFLCCFWWLGFLFSHCARCVHVFCVVLQFFHYCTVVTVGSLCPWTLNFYSYKSTCVSTWLSSKVQICMKCQAWLWGRQNIILDF